MSSSRLHARQLADGPATPVVLSHALGLDHRMWSSTAQRWRGKRPVLAYDHRGHGRSPAPAGALTMADFVGDAIELIEDWGRGPVIFVGLSMGGMVAQALALRRPELVAGLVLAHTVARYPPAARDAWQQRITAVQAGGMAAVADMVVTRYLRAEVREARPALAAELRAQLLANDAASYALCCGAVAQVDTLDQLDRIACPTLAIAGAHDVGAPPEMVRALHERIAGSQFALLDGASHLGPLEQPEAFESLLQRFIDRVEGALARSR